MEPLTADPVAVAAAKGHTVRPDPPAAISVAQRWTCTACGKAVLLREGIVYGSATTDLCGSDVIRYLPLGAPQPMYWRESGFGVEERSLSAHREAGGDGEISVLSWIDGMAAMLTGARGGAAMFQRFICEGCRAIMTMPLPDHIYEVGRCEECGHLTDLQRAGFGVIGMVAPADATPEQEAAFRAEVESFSTELVERPDAYVLRAHGREVRHKVHRAPCRNCGQPDHHGQPCEIRFRGGRRRI